MKALITGITGFVGPHLAELLLKEGFTVFGLVHRPDEENNLPLSLGEVKLLYGDLRDSNTMERIVGETGPDYVFHLAGQSGPTVSLKIPAETIDINVIGQINLFEAIRKSGYDPVIQIACSSEEYGAVRPEENPVEEGTPLRPVTPYACSKIAQDYLAYQYFRSYGMKIIRTRAFNHTGPGRSDAFAISNFAKQIVEIENNKRSILEVGNLQAKRDFNDVRDIVRAYLLAVKKCQYGEVYNICSGRAYSLKQILDTLLSIAKAEAIVKQDPTRLRKNDVPVLFGDSTKFRKATGWKPEIPIEKTLEDILNYWRNELSD